MKPERVALARALVVSPPARGRGLKHLTEGPPHGPQLVAPRAGAWIETMISPPVATRWLSPPARGRGLKHDDEIGNKAMGKSPPARGRGLKPLGV